jgi:pimeloyl-ACP methyl ester carboxylesterase
MAFEAKTLSDANGPFRLDLFEAADPARTVIFAAGRGGSPGRHQGLLRKLAEAGCTVIAPHFDMIASQVPSAEDLRARLSRIEKALDEFAPPEVPLVGVGHSIGASLLLIAAGADAWTLSRERVSLKAVRDFRKLLLFAPPTGFFRGPGALDRVRVSVTVWAGTHDTITPPDQAHFLKEVMGDKAEVHLAEGAGHFAFMDELPPGLTDTHPDRSAFLSDLAEDVRRSVIDA